MYCFYRYLWYYNTEKSEHLYYKKIYTDCNRAPLYNVNREGEIKKTLKYYV